MICCILIACQSLPLESQTAITQNDPAVQQRQQQLNALSSWQLDGRISLVTDEEAWSGQLYWQQNADSEYLIQFNSPSGQGAMQLLGSEEGVELRMANGNIYQAKDADTLLRQETNWDLPIDGLWYWIRGLPDPELPAQIILDKQGMIQDLQQNDWKIQYKRYQQFGAFYFPRKIIVQHQDMKVRLIVTQWVVS